MTTYGAVAPSTRITAATTDLRPARRSSFAAFPGKIRSALAASIERSRQADRLAGCGASAELGRQTGISC